MEYLEISNNLRSQFNQNKLFAIDKFNLTTFQQIFRELFSTKCNKENKSYYSWLSKNIKNYLSNETSFNPEELTSLNKEILYTDLFLINNEYPDYERLSDWLNFVIREEKILPDDFIPVTNRNLISCLVLDNINNKFDPIIKYYMEQKPKNLFFIGDDVHTLDIIINTNPDREIFINFIIKHNISLTAPNIRFNHMVDTDLDIIIQKKLISHDNQSSWHNIYAQKLKNKKQEEQILIMNSFTDMEMSAINLPVSNCLLQSSFSNFANKKYYRNPFYFDDTLFSQKFNHQTEFLEQNKYELSLNIIQWPDDDDLKLPFFKYFIDFLNNNNVFLDSDKLYDFFSKKITAYTEDEIRPYLAIIVNNEQNILTDSLNQNKIKLKQRL